VHGRLDPVLELQFVQPLCVILLRFATPSLRIAVEWLRQVSLLLRVRA
jgi:hypothetical protein